MRSPINPATEAVLTWWGELRWERGRCTYGGGWRGAAGAVRRHSAGPERGEREPPRRCAQKMYDDTDGEGARGGLSSGCQWVVVDPSRERGAVDGATRWDGGKEAGVV